MINPRSGPFICTNCSLKFDKCKSLTNHVRWCLNRMDKKNFLGLSGHKNPNWKGEEVGYHAIHDYIKYYIKKPELCECCGLKKPLDLSNINGRYLRISTDWEWLCRKCHFVADGRTKDGQFIIKYIRNIIKAHNKLNA